MSWTSSFPVVCSRLSLSPRFCYSQAVPTGLESVGISSLGTLYFIIVTNKIVLASIRNACWSFAPFSGHMSPDNHHVGHLPAVPALTWTKGGEGKGAGGQMSGLCIESTCALWLRNKIPSLGSVTWLIAMSGLSPHAAFDVPLCYHLAAASMISHNTPDAALQAAAASSSEAA